MIKKFYLIPLFLLALSFVACSESEDAGTYENWRERNEAFIDSLQQVVDSGSDPALKHKPYGRNKSLILFYKVMETGPTETENHKPIDPAYWTSSVEVFYRGKLINNTVFDQNFTGANPSEFDSPNLFAVNSGLITGWSEVLQLMRVGDRFEVYLPHELAYGESGNGTAIPAFSTLIFDIQVTKVNHYPQ